MIARALAALLLLPVLAGSALAAQCGGDFQTFVAAMSREAQGQGVSQAVISQALGGVTQDQAVLAFDRRQRGTFNKTFEQYVATRVGAQRIKRATAMMQRHAALLSRIEQRFGVPRQIVVAIWTLETDNGGDMGKLSVFRVLATMAHDCRRTELFQRELHAALKIVQRGDLPLNEMIGAYAGEIGQTQFLPSSVSEIRRRLRRQRSCRSPPQHSGRAGLDGEPAEGQRLEGRRTLQRGDAELRGDARVEPGAGVSQDHRVFRRSAGRAVTGAVADRA